MVTTRSNSTSRSTKRGNLNKENISNKKTKKDQDVKKNNDKVSSSPIASDTPAASLSTFITVTPAAAPKKAAAATVTPAAAKADDEPKKKCFRLEKVFASGRYWYDMRTELLGTYATREEAIQAAKKARDDSHEFQGWGNGKDDDSPPPYALYGKCTSYYSIPFDGRTNVIIRIVDTRTFGKSPDGSLPARELDQMNKIDENIFYRNPCRIQGGKSYPPNRYGTGTGINSYAFLMQRLSNRNYAMRSFCLEEGSSAKFYGFKNTRFYSHQVGWEPDTNLNQHANDESIVDTLHLDLIQSGTTVLKSLLTAENLKATVTPSTTCLFLNAFRDHETTAEVIATCAGSLQCVSLVSTSLSKKVFEALSKCPKLSGITISTEDAPSPKSDDDDKAFGAMLKACSGTLKWLFVDIMYRTPRIMETESWRALGSGANDFPNLQVLWVNNTACDGERRGIAVGDHSVIRSALQTRGKSLKLLMINPNQSLQSRFVYGKKSDLLKGNKIRSNENPWGFMM